MGPQGCTLEFPDTQPTSAELANEAMRIGDIAILRTETATEASFAFEDFPQNWVSISYQDSNQLFIIDDSLSAPVLFRLLVHAARQLGGQPQTHTESLSTSPLAITQTMIRKETSQVKLSCWAFLIAVTLLLIAVLAGAVVTLR